MSPMNSVDRDIREGGRGAGESGLDPTCIICRGTVWESRVHVLAYTKLQSI